MQSLRPGGGWRGVLAAEGLAGELVFRFVRVFIRVVGFRYLRLRTIGAQRLRVEGPVIFAPAHRSHLDGPLIGSLTHRRVRYLGKEQLFRPRPLGWFMSAVGAFPVRRGEADLDALRAALGLLRDGEAMLVFPEGTRQPTDEIAEIFDGTAWLAAKSGVPVLPIGLAGTRHAMPAGAKLPKPVRSAIVVGAPMDPPVGPNGTPARRPQMTEWTARLRSAIDDCQQQALRLADAAGPALG